MSYRWERGLPIRGSTPPSFYTYAGRTRLLRGGNPIAQVERRKVEAYAAAQQLEPSFVADRMAKIDRTTLAGACRSGNAERGTRKLATSQARHSRCLPRSDLRLPT